VLSNLENFRKILSKYQSSKVVSCGVNLKIEPPEGRLLHHRRPLLLLIEGGRKIIAI
jgi:hypothetical protein